MIILSYNEKNEMYRIYDTLTEKYIDDMNTIECVLRMSIFYAQSRMTSLVFNESVIDKIDEEKLKGSF